jgi:hypothetical protein
MDGKVLYQISRRSGAGTIISMAEKKTKEVFHAGRGEDTVPVPEAKETSARKKQTTKNAKCLCALRGLPGFETVRDGCRYAWESAS